MSPSHISVRSVCRGAGFSRAVEADSFMPKFLGFSVGSGGSLSRTTSSRSSMSSRRKAKEKMKVTLVWQKIFGLPDDVQVSCTSARVPALRAHSESIVFEIVKKVTLEEARRCSGRCLA